MSKKREEIFRMLNDGYYSRSINSKRNEIAEGLRESLLQSKSTQGFLFVVGVTDSQLDFFLNWACSAEMNKVFDPKAATYIVTVDEKAYKVLTELGFVVEPLEWITYSAESIGKKRSSIKEFVEEYFTDPTVDKSGYNKQYGLTHSVINSLVTMAVNFFLDQNFKVIQMDIDSVFTGKNISLIAKSKGIAAKYLNRALKRRDVLGMFSERDDEYEVF